VSLSTMRIAVMRRLYRVAWRGVQLRALVWPRKGGGVKCVLTHAGEVLLVRHTYGRREVWYLPGGAARRGESPVRTAAREMEEELGVSELPLRELAAFDIRLERISVRLTCLHAEVADPARMRTDPVEIAEVGWFAPERLPTPRGTEVDLVLKLLARDAPGPDR
jgi:ADP-ribose pyrophosphatase YjhB (NUDIX family)